jgi:hypothetical protein
MEFTQLLVSINDELNVWHTIQRYMEERLPLKNIVYKNTTLEMMVSFIPVVSDLEELPL